MLFTNRLFILTASFALAGTNALASAQSAGAGQTPQGSVPIDPSQGADALLEFGIAMVALTGVCAWQERRFPWLAVGTSLFALAAAGYGLAVGAWPLGVATGAYAVLSLGRYNRTQRPQPGKVTAHAPRRFHHQPLEESRLIRLFGEHLN